MSAVKAIESQVMEEVTGAQEYMNCADSWKNQNSTIAAYYNDMAKQELDHARRLQDMLPLIKGTGDFTEDQKTIINFLVEMNADQIRRVANK